MTRISGRMPSSSKLSRFSSSPQVTTKPSCCMEFMNSRKAALRTSRVEKWSTWSNSRLVMIAPVGLYERKEPSDSSASATKISPLPRWALVPELFIIPPIAKEGSRPALWSATVSIAVVVVFPWVPATATDLFPCITSASASARGIISAPRSFAANNSGLSDEIAEETTITSAPTWFASLWPR